MARSGAVEAHPFRDALFSRQAARPLAFTSHMAGEVGLEPTSYCFGDSHFSLNYSPMSGGRRWSRTNRTNMHLIYSQDRCLLRDTRPYWYWRWESNPQKTSASKADDFANLSTPAYNAPSVT